MVSHSSTTAGEQFLLLLPEKAHKRSDFVISLIEDLLYIVAVLTGYEIFYVEVFFAGKHFVVFDPFSKFMVDLTRLCDLT